MPYGTARPSSGILKSCTRTGSGSPLTQLATGVLEVADQLLLFGVYRNRRFTRGQSGADLSIDIAELFVPIRTAAALAGLAVALQAVVQLSQQIGDNVVPDAVAHRAQRLGEIAQAATGPQQRRLWVAARRRLDQTPQVGQQRGVGRS